MENFTIGEIIWAKIRGYPWWPAKITAISDDNKEKKYTVGFIGDNTHAVLPKPKLAKFMKEFKEFSKTKKKALLESIRIAKDLYDAKYKNEYEDKTKINSCSNIKKNLENNSNNNYNNNINCTVNSNSNGLGNTQNQGTLNSNGTNNNNNNANLLKDTGKKEAADKKLKNLSISTNNNLSSTIATSKDYVSSGNNKTFNNNNNIKNKINSIANINNSDLTNSNLSYNKDSNEINDLQLSEEIIKEYESDADKSEELSKHRDKEMKKRRLAAASDRDPGKSRSAVSSLGKSKMRENFTKLKRRRRLNERMDSENDCSDLMIKIINYLLYVSKNIETINIENNKECLFKVLDYLKDYKMENPIGYLKQTSLGIMIKYIQSKIPDAEIQELSNQVYKNFEEQVLDQLFIKNK